MWQLRVSRAEIKKSQVMKPHRNTYLTTAVSNLVSIFLTSHLSLPLYLLAAAVLPLQFRHHRHKPP
jgi:hypothetical protein